MKVVAGCSLDDRTIMKNFEFEDGTPEEKIRETVDIWAEGLFKSWYVICNPEGEDKYGE